MSYRVQHVTFTKCVKDGEDIYIKHGSLTMLTSRRREPN